MRKITGDDILKIALANPDVIVPPDAHESCGKAKRNKYNAVKCSLDGMRFDSKAEMRRWGDLRYLELSGMITALEFHPVFPLYAGVKYVADFRYIEAQRVIVEDVKGGKATQTQTWRNKWKMAKEKYSDIEFRVVEN